MRHRSVRYSRYSKAGGGYIERLGREEEGEKEGLEGEKVGEEEEVGGKVVSGM